VARSRQLQQPTVTPGARRCLRKFLQLFSQGYRDPEYVELEREYKWRAHQRWEGTLSGPAMAALLRRHRYAELAAAAVAIESRTNLLFSFEKMALRDAVRSSAGARRFAEGLYQFLHGKAEPAAAFTQWCATLSRLPRRQTRVLTWPMATVFGFLAQPTKHIFYKPRVTQTAARRYGFELHYTSRPDWPAYQRLLAFASQVRRDTRHLGPRDLIDIQSFIWIQGSEEYE
jgi:hypothetical protein